MSRIRQTTSKKDFTQHFIQGIGDGNLHSDFDLLPDSSHQKKRTRHHYIRTAVGSRGGNNRRRRDKGDVVGIAAVDEDLQEEEEEEKKKNDAHDNAMLHGGRGDGGGSSINSSSHHQVEDIPASSMFSFAVSPLAFLLIPLAVFLLTMAFRKEFSRRQSYKKKGPDRKLLRTESQALRQKKKTDEWEEEELDSEYNDLITRRRSLVGETNIHNDHIDDNNINDNNNILSVTRNPSSPCCYRRESYLRGEHARHRKVKGVTDSRQHALLNQSYHDRKTTQEDSFPRMQQVSSFDHVDQELDEEALSPIARSRTFSFDDLEQRTLTVVGGSRKPIYVSSFSELTMPDLSSHTIPVEDTISISDGNAKILEGNEDDGSVHSQECAISGETEGANGLIHKRRDLTACSDAASSLHSPIVYSDLKMNHLIGGGGFGQVWSATWRGTPVAVKVLSASSESLMVQKAILQEFVAEINMLSGMRHPNICLYIGACLEPTNRAIVTELAANGSLWDALRLPLKTPFGTQERGQPLWPLELYGSNDPESILHPPEGTWPWSLVRRVAEGAARGMNYLHCGKPAVLHRDLKSANILLDDSYNPKVCDFGLSRIKTHENSMTANCGTVQWMAPEILANEPYAEPADVYSYGIILWELLTRRCPYEGMNSIQCAMAVLNRDLRPEIPAWCPTIFANLISECVDKEPSNRPTFAIILSTLDTMPKY